MYSCCMIIYYYSIIVLYFLLCFCRSKMMNIQENAASPSFQNGPDGILSKNEGNELEKRMIKEEFLTNWFRKKQLEEEVMIELFGKDMFNMVKDSFLQSNKPKETEETSNKPLTDLQKRGEPNIQGGQSFIAAEDCLSLWLGDHAEAGNRPFQHPRLRAKNDTNGKMVLDFSIRTSTPSIIPGKDALETKRKIESPIVEQGDKTALNERNNKRINGNVKFVN